MHDQTISHFTYTMYGTNNSQVKLVIVCIDFKIHTLVTKNNKIWVTHPCGDKYWLSVDKIYLSQYCSDSSSVNGYSIALTSSSKHCYEFENRNSDIQVICNTAIPKGAEWLLNIHFYIMYLLSWWLFHSKFYRVTNHNWYVNDICCVYINVIQSLVKFWGLHH